MSNLATMTKWVMVSLVDRNSFQFFNRMRKETRRYQRPPLKSRFNNSEQRHSSLIMLISTMNSWIMISISYRASIHQATSSHLSDGCWMMKVFHSLERFFECFFISADIICSNKQVNKLFIAAEEQLNTNWDDTKPCYTQYVDVDLSNGNEIRFLVWDMKHERDEIRHNYSNKMVRR